MKNGHESTNYKQLKTDGRFTAARTCVRAPLRRCWNSRVALKMEGSSVHMSVSLYLGAHGLQEQHASSRTTQ